MSGEVKILDGNTFVVSDEAGDIEASLTDPTGLFAFDTRFLSKWVLTVDGQRLNPLSVDDLQYFETRFFLVPGTGTVYIDAKLSVIRQRAVGGGFHEELTILNHDETPADLEVRIEAGSDFADLFEVKDALQKKGEYYTRVDDGRLVLGYKRETYVRETWVSATAACAVDEHGLTFKRPRGAPRRVDHRPPRDARARRRGAQHRRSPSTSGTPRTRCRSWSGACRSGWTRLRRWPATGTRSSGPTSAASWTWRRCASRRCRCPATTCRRPGCPGS